MNSRLGKSVSDHYRAKIRLGKFKAVYSKCYGTVRMLIEDGYSPRALVSHWNCSVFWDLK